MIIYYIYSPKKKLDNRHPHVEASRLTSGRRAEQSSPSDVYNLKDLGVGVVFIVNKRA